MRNGWAALFAAGLMAIVAGPLTGDLGLCFLGASAMLWAISVQVEWLEKRGDDESA